jgi:acyl-CoA thioester hydrolase
VPAEWIDYNGHMMDAYYFMAFTEATEAFLDHVGLGAAYRAQTGSGIYTAESHLCFLSGVVGGADLTYQTQLLGHDAKRLHVFHRMSDSGTLVATCELMFLHVSRERVAPMPPEAVAAVDALAVLHAALPRPERAGRRVAMPQRVLRVLTERMLRGGFTKVASAGPTRATAGRATGGATATPRRAAGLAGASGSGASRVASAGRRAGVTEPPAWSVSGVLLAGARRPHPARRPWPGGWPTARAAVMTAPVPVRMAPRNSGRLPLPPRAEAVRLGDRPGSPRA